MPEVSIIMPVYNGAKYIAEAIATVFAQTYKDWELIVVDDGSEDNTAQVVAEFSPTVRYIWQQNRGLSAARNLGIRHAQGDFIALLDADDLWMSTFLESSVSAIQKNSKVGLIYSWWHYVDELGRSLPEIGNYARKGNLLLELILSNRFPVISVLVRKYCIVEAGFFDESLQALEDWDLWLRIAANGWEFDYVPQVLAQYRRHGSNMSRDVKRMEKSYLAVLDKLAASSVDSQITHLIPSLQANVYLNSALSYHMQGNLPASYQSLTKAIQIWPLLLNQEETWYRWICADQPPGYQDTSYFKDLDLAARRIESLLSQLFTDHDIAPLINHEGDKINRVAMFTLAKHHYVAGDSTTVRRYLLTLFKQNPVLLVETQTALLFLKSCIGRQRIVILRHLWITFKSLVLKSSDVD